MTRHLTERDLRHWLSVEENPQTRKTIKTLLVGMADPDPLTETDAPDDRRDPTGGDRATDLHDQPLAERESRSTHTRLRRGLDRLAGAIGLGSLVR